MRLSFRRRELAPLSVPRAFATAVGLGDGRVVVLGGNARRPGDTATGACEVACQSSDVVEIVDAERGAVTARAGLRAAREGARATRARGGVLVMGGIADYG